MVSIPAQHGVFHTLLFSSLIYLFAYCCCQLLLRAFAASKTVSKQSEWLQLQFHFELCAFGRAELAVNWREKFNVKSLKGIMRCCFSFVETAKLHMRVRNIYLKCSFRFVCVFSSLLFNFPCKYTHLPETSSSFFFFI